MSGQHTPGPWTYESDHTHRQYNIRMMGHMIGGHICTVNNLPTDVLASRDPGIAAANAALIAAAPDLLACAIKLRAMADWLPHPHCVEVIEMADAAIAKATGQ